jgi:PKD repeat protein
MRPGFGPEPKKHRGDSVNTHVTRTGFALLLLVLLVVPAPSQAEERACTLQCFTTVPTVTVAGESTYFLGTINWWECPGSPTYIWDFGDGSPTGTHQFEVNNYMTPGTYTWTLTVNLEGNTCTTTGSIIVDPTATGCGFGATGLPTGLSVLGNATRAAGAGIELTPDQADRTGVVWCMNLSPVYAGFDTTFRFQVAHDARRDAPGAEGFAFVLDYDSLRYASAVGKGGARLGYGELWGLAVEFDTAMNPEMEDPDGNHVSIMKNRLNAGLTAHHSDSLATATPPFDIADGAVHKTRIHYEPGVFSVYLDGAIAPILSLPINIAEIVGFPNGECFAGFTASTGTEFEAHRILDWTFTPAGPECVLICDAVAPAVAAPGVPAYFVGSDGTTDCQGTPAYDWDFGDGAPHNTLKNPVHEYAAAGTFTWTMTVTVEDKVCTKTGTITVREPCVLACDATVPATAPQAQPVAFQAQATATNCSGATTYSWAFGDGATSTEQNPTHIYAAAGSYNWTLTVTAEGETCTRIGTVALGGIPGDCNGDGSVSIGEVQKAINMFLGIEPVGCGADCGGDGTVSIGEVQKVINSFLGLANSC